MQQQYASGLHQYIDEYLSEQRQSWTALMLEAGVGPQRGTDIKRGAIPRPDTLRRIASAMKRPYEDLARAAGYLNPIPDTEDMASTGTTTLGTRSTDRDEEIARQGPGRGYSRTRLEEGLGHELQGIPEDEIHELAAFYQLGWNELTQEERDDVRSYLRYVRFRKFDARESD